MRANVKGPEAEMLLSEVATKVDLSPEVLCRVNCLCFTWRKCLRVGESQRGCSDDTVTAW